MRVHRLAESEWRRACEATKRCGVEIGEVVALSNFCHQGMPSLPNDETLVVERTERRGLHVTSDTSSSQPSVLDSPRSTQPTVQARQLPREQPFETPTRNERPAGARPLPMPSGPQYGSPKIEQPERKVSKPTNEATPKAAGRRSATPPEILSPSPRPSRILTTIASLDAAVATPLATPSLSHGVTASTSSDGIVVSLTASEISPATAPLRLRGDSDRKDGRSELGAGRPLPKGFVWEEAEEAATKRAGGVARNASIESTESSRSFVARMKVRSRPLHSLESAF